MWRRGRGQCLRASSRGAVFRAWQWETGRPRGTEDRPTPSHKLYYYPSIGPSRLSSLCPLYPQGNTPSFQAGSAWWITQSSRKATLTRPGRKQEVCWAPELGAIGAGVESGV